MEETPARALEVVPPTGDAPEEEARGQNGGTDVLRKAGEAVALLSVTALVGGGAGMLVGVAFGAINPFALGIVGAVAGIGLLVLLAVGPRGAWWRRVFGG